MNNLMNDGRLYVLQISVSVYLNITEYCVDLQLLLHSTVSNSHINVRLEVSHKQKLTDCVWLFYMQGLY